MKPLLSLATVATLASTLAAQQQLVLPDFQYLCESTTQVGQTGSTSWWRSTTGGRFQIVYEASHFLGKAGVGGQITIDKLMFRGESGEPNQGGQSWAGVTVSVGVTTLSATANTFTNTFATNLAPGGGHATLMNPPFVIPVTVDPSVGSTPNNYNIVINLPVSPAFNYDPTNPLLPNLLIDITLPGVATLPTQSGSVMAVEDTTGAITLVRGRGVSSNNPLALTGTLLNPPVVGIEFHGGSGGYSPPVPARNEFYGAACGGSPSSFYQSFLNGQPFDLGGSSLILRPNLPPNMGRPDYYDVINGVEAINYAAATAPLDLVSTADDALAPLVILPWAFLYPGGPVAGTTSIRPCTDGYIWLDATPPTGADNSPSVTELLTQTARLLPFWYDFHCGRNLTTRPLSGLYVNIAGPAGTRTCTVTWREVGVFNSVGGTGVGDHAVHTVQCVIHEFTGVVEYHYGPGTLVPQFCSNTTTAQGTYAGIVGFSPGDVGGSPVADPKSRDLSHEVPFRTEVEGYTSHMGLTAVVTTGDPGGVSYGGRMFGGQTLSWVVSDVPPTTFGLLLLDLAPLYSFNLGLVGWPDCLLSVTPNPVVILVDLFPTSTQTTGSVTIPHGWEGVDIFAQYIATDLWFPRTASSNAIKHTVGLD